MAQREGYPIERIKCSVCGKEGNKNHYWGAVKSEDWFFSRAEEKAYCPEHIPDWVESWRARRKAKKGTP